MIGVAVDENCDHIPSSSSHNYTNSSVLYTHSVAEYSVTASLSTSVPDSSRSLDTQCRVGVAVALTCIAGIFQVSSLELSSATFDFCILYLH